MWTEIVIGTAAAVYIGVRASQVLNEDRGCDVAGLKRSNEPDLVRFANLVRAMRAAQTLADRYKEPCAGATDAVRELEKRVDEALAWVGKHRQPGLFKSPDHDQGGDGAYPQRRGNPGTNGHDRRS